ncbi:hypothetical protein K7711_00635 [Nocardia sp. CA2R105]|uniref:hypothetical protein n=1 Tax=Nocardia coffeae TaxID=2873381 RepID=UPI001CA67E48|nr:hypothetical protein [Nocardia coffeae]MBY8854976.1 hypothetical protein [Nocardia coffeae]
MIVDWQIYYDAAKKCHDLADDLRRADKPVHQAVKGECTGMAGDAPGCKEWGQTYDKSAQQTLQACSSLANALTNYGSVLYAMGYNYGVANKSNPAPSQPSIPQVGEYRVQLPSSVADNGIGFTDHGGVKAFFDKLVAKVLSAFGKLPNGDATKLDKAQTTWNAFANHATITGAASQISAISAQFDNMDDATNRQLVQDHFTTLKTGADTVSTAAKAMSGPVGDYHGATVALGHDISSKINTLELTIAVIAIAGGVVALFSLGAAAAPATAAIEADAIATVEAIETTYQASSMTKVIGLASLTAGAVGVIDAFHALPSIDLDKAVKNLAVIIAMKAIIDAEGNGDSDDAALPNVRDPKTFDPQSLTGKTMEEVAKGIPSDWTQSPSKSGDGTVYRDPQNFGRQIRVMPGYTDGNRPNPLTHGPYVEVSQNGSTTKVPLAGNPTLGGPK